jgi:hypothetical protein
MAATAGASRIRGWLLVVFGSCLSLGAALLAAFLGWTIAGYQYPRPTHWAGSHEMTIQVFVLFATVFVFGLVAAGAGVFQLRRGRVSWLANSILFVLAGMMVFIGYRIMNLPG